MNEAKNEPNEAHTESNIDQKPQNEINNQNYCWYYLPPPQPIAFQPHAQQMNDMNQSPDFFMYPYYPNSQYSQIYNYSNFYPNINWPTYANNIYHNENFAKGQTTTDNHYSKNYSKSNKPKTYSKSNSNQNDLNYKHNKKTQKESVLNIDNNNNSNQHLENHPNENIITNNVNNKNTKFSSKNEGYQPIMIPAYADPNYMNYLASGMNFIPNKYKTLNLNYMPPNYTNINNINNNNYNNRPSHLDKYNPKNFMYNGEKEGAKSSKFFVIKSYSKQDVIHSIEHGVWCSTENGNKKLNQAFNECSNHENASVYLFFSVNSSGHFCGLAEMISNVDFDAKSNLWAQDKWKGKFNVKWVFVKDVPNVKLKHVIIESNENKPVTNSRDTQEIPFDKAIEVLNVFKHFVHRTTILDNNTNSNIDNLQNNSSSVTVKAFSYKQQKMKQTNSSLTDTTNTKTEQMQSKKISAKNEDKNANGVAVKKQFLNNNSNNNNNNK